MLLTCFQYHVHLTYSGLQLSPPPNVLLAGSVRFEIMGSSVWRYALSLGRQDGELVLQFINVLHRTRISVEVFYAINVAERAFFEDTSGKFIELDEDPHELLRECKETEDCSHLRHFQ